MKLNEIFYTIQGEGRNVGRAALFLRLPFCNLSCTFCDTEFDSFFETTEEELADQLRSCRTRFAVITGGEPSMNKDCPALVRLLKSEGYEIAMESNGQFLTPSEIDFLTVSPKRWTTKRGHPGTHPPFWFDTRNTPSEIRLVIDSEDAFLAADKIFGAWERGEFQFKPGTEPAFYVSPEWGARGSLLPKIIDFVKERPAWKISLQTHKILNVL